MMGVQESFDNDVHDTVRKLLSDTNRVPFLFIGSGLSRRYRGTEDWEGLLKWVCDSVGFPFMQPFYVYKQQASAQIASSQDKNALYPQIASLMERDFLTALNTPPLAEWSSSHIAELEAGIPALKIYVAEHLAEYRAYQHSHEVELLKNTEQHVAGIITTNYDTLMEAIFPSYKVFSQQEDLLFSRLTEVGEIYKIHGSITVPESMVMTKEDYDKLQNTQQYLFSKIFTIFGEYPIIFLGYSLQDQDIRNIIASIASCAGEERATEIAQRFIFVEYSDKAKIQRTNYQVDNTHVVEMTTLYTQNFAPIYEAIASTHVRYSPKLLRQITRQLFEASYSGGAKTSVNFVNLKDLDNLPQDLEIVVGVGLHNYGKPITNEDIHIDTLLRSKNLPAALVVTEYLRRFFNQDIPFYYYLTNFSGRITPVIQSYISKRQSIDDYLNNTQKKRKSQWERNHVLKERSITDLREHFGENAYKFITVLAEEEIDIDQLEKLLSEKVMSALEKKEKLDSDLRKGIRIYDYLKYGKPYLAK